MGSMNKLTYKPLALADLDGIYDITGSDYPQRGYDFVEAIRARCRKNLLSTPKIGRERNDLGEGIRVYPIKDKRTVVAYRIAHEEIVIVRVFYGGADYEAALLDMDDLA